MNRDIMLPELDSENIPRQGQAPALHQIMKIMADKEASDCFVSVGSQVKIKINGEIYQVSPYRILEEDIDMMLVESLHSDQIVELEKTKDLNCALSLPGVGRFRISAFYQRNSCAFVLRFIPPQIPSFQTLGMPSVLMELSELSHD